ncbi:MAG TPA: WD40 repeat domain-containing protein, partial [Ktedonobacteraceae bacterium]|nr:WD40 repeat domain-containing protein [Ktedonobacteraceae bacterium]
MTSEMFCLRCERVQLLLLPASRQEIQFYRCPQCHRQYTLLPGKSLTERWPGALSLVLYGVIFSLQPQKDAERIVALLRDQQSEETLARIEEEIRLELASPTQSVRDILDLRASEQDLREFLALVANKLDEELQAFPLIKSLQGHRGWVYSLAISADGQILASGGNDQTVKLWEPRTGELLHTYTEATGAVFAVAISPDSQLIAGGSADQTIRLWERQTRTLRHTLYGHAGQVHSVAFNPEGTILASGSTDATIRVWSVQTGQLLRVLRGHARPVHCVAISPDGKKLVSGSSGKTLCVWDLTTGQLLRTLQEHTN